MNSRIRFTADEAEFDADEYSLIAGVSNSASGDALSFDRASEVYAVENPSDDWGVHTQFNDQSNGAYNCVRQIRLSRTLLSVDLSRALGNLQGVVGFDVELAVDDETYARFCSGMLRVFRNVLVVS